MILVNLGSLYKSLLNRPTLTSPKLVVNLPILGDVYEDYEGNMFGTLFYMAKGVKMELSSSFVG